MSNFQNGALPSEFSANIVGISESQKLFLIQFNITVKDLNIFSSDFKALT
jgi:hypothetical protein